MHQKLKKWQLELNVSVSPNPINRLLTVRLSNSWGEAVMLRVLNAEGRQLRLIPPGNVRDKVLTLDMGNYSGGVFLLDAVTKSEYRTLKIIKAQKGKEGICFKKTSGDVSPEVLI